MARTNSVNFTGPLQYPMASAAGDLFHKEDVQVLAQAVDQHTHASGKGLPLAAGAIPNGLITTANMAANASTQAQIQTSDGAVYTRTPTFSPVQLPGVPSISLTLTGGPVLLWGQVFWSHSLANATAGFGFSLDGATPSITALEQNSATATSSRLTTFMGLLTPTAGVHTFSLGWDNQTGGTLSRGSWYSTIMAVELKR